MQELLNDFDGTIGTEHQTSNNVRTDLTVRTDLVVNSELDRQIARLLILHPSLQIKFRQNDLASLNDETKLILLEDMRDVLGICR